MTHNRLRFVGAKSKRHETSIKKNMKCTRTIEELGEDLFRVERLCHSTEITQEPFLGPEDELRDVISKDMETLKRLNVTHTQVAQRMKSILIAVRNSPKADLRISQRIEATREVKRKGWCAWSNTCYDIENFIVEINTWGGAQRCPFQHPEDETYHGYRYGSQDVYVLNKTTNEIIFFSSLLPHMIKRHAFFEGAGLYRVDPESVVRILEIRPLQSYRLDRTVQDVWYGVGNYPSIPKDAKCVYVSKTRNYWVAESVPDEMWTMPVGTFTVSDVTSNEEPPTINGMKVILQPFLDGIYRKKKMKFYNTVAFC